MRRFQTLAGLCCVAVLALGAWAQEAPESAAETGAEPVVESVAPPAPTTAVAMPTPESVLEHVPADALGYVVVPDVGALLGQVDTYLAEVGLVDLVGPAMPDGALEGVRTAAMLGEGFNPSGGFALVLLDPAKLDVDLLAIMGLAEEPTTQPETEPVAPKLPIVILVPGLSVESVFSNYEIIPTGEYSQVILRMGPMLATQRGGYVCLSPSAEALDALAAAEAVSPAGEQAELLARSDITAHINMEIAAPLIDKMLAKAVESMEQGGSPPMIKGIWSSYMGMYKELCSQMTGVTVGGRFAPTGVVIEALAGFKPDSPLGKSLAAAKPVEGNLLNRVSSPSYILAIGSREEAPEVTEEQTALAMDMIDTWLAMPPFSTLDDQTKADLRALTTNLADQQAGGMQLVIGGAPEGAGLFAASLVLQCKDSTAMKELLLGAVGLAETLIKTFADEEELPFRIVATRQVATVDGLTVDAIEFFLIEPQAQPAMTAPAEPMPPEETPTIEDEPLEAEPTATVEEDPAEETAAAEEATPEPAATEETAVAEEEVAEDPVTVVMGEDKIRFYLVAVDPQTLVITFGGAQPYLAEAVRVAKAGDGAILSDPAVQEALAVMPKNMSGVGLLNAGNLFDVIVNAAVRLEGPGAAPPFRITTKAPIAFGGGVSGTLAHAVYYIPNELVKEGVDIFKTLVGPPEPTTAPAPSEEGDF